MRQLVVDLGTSRTVAVLVVDAMAPRVLMIDGFDSMPSGVYAEDDGRMYVGSDAERRAHLDPSRYTASPGLHIRETTVTLGNRAVPVVEALAAVLNRVAEEAYRAAGGPIDQLLLTVPDYWAPVEHQALRHAVALTPLRAVEVQVVPAVLAAGANCARSLGLPPGLPFAVYDLGAGGFSCAVVTAGITGMTTLAAGGAPGFGGVDADNRLLHYVGERVAGADPRSWNALESPSDAASRRTALVVREHVRRARNQLDTADVVTLELPPPFGEVQLTRAELNTLLRPQLEHSVLTLVETVGRAGLVPGELTGVFLLGDLGRTSLAAELVGAHFRVLGVGEAAAVALGAPDAVRTDYGKPAFGVDQDGAARRSRRTLALAGAAVVLVVVLVAALAVVLLRNSSSSTPQAAALTTVTTTTAATSTTATGAPATSSTSPPTTTKAAAGAPVPLILGWQPVVAPDRGAVYDVPPGWKVSSADTIGGFETKAGERVLGKGYTTFASDFCSKYGSKAVSVLTGSKESDLAAGATDAATRWATVAFTDDNTGLAPPLQTSPPVSLTTSGGMNGSLVEVTGPLVKQKDCDASAGSMFAFATPGAKGGTFVLVIYAARGVPEEISAAVVRQIVSSVRPL